MARSSDRNYIMMVIIGIILLINFWDILLIGLIFYWWAFLLVGLVIYLIMLKQKNARKKNQYLGSYSREMIYRRCLNCGHTFPVVGSSNSARCSNCSETVKLSKSITPDLYNQIKSLLNYCHNCNRQIREREYACGRCGLKVDYEQQILQAMRKKGMRG